MSRGGRKDLAKERWADVRVLFFELVDLEGEARAARLAELADGEPELVEELRRLLAASDRSDELLGGFDALMSSPPDLVLAADTGLDAAGTDPHGLIGRTVSHYEVVDLLGAGGMGVLYRAIDTALDRSVVLKFLPPHWGLDDAFRQRFLREARAAAALEHPNVCTIYEIGETEDGRLFIAMPLYEGETVQEKIARGPLEVDEALDVACQTARGLAAAHAAGLIHRDIKPANLFVTAEGGLKILDFGLAKTDDSALTEAGFRLGTAAYMSPEQTRGEEVSEETDYWSLGVVLYEMVTGRRPFRGGSTSAVIHAIRSVQPEAPRRLRQDLPSEVDTLTLQLLSKEPGSRSTGATKLAEETSKPGDVGTLVGRPGSIGLRRRRVAFGAAGILVLLAASMFADRALRERAAGSVSSRSVAVLPLADHSPGDEVVTAAGPREREALEALPTTNEEAYRLYRRGVALSGDRLRASDERRALRLFERAVELDPGFELARIGIAVAKIELYFQGVEGAEILMSEAEQLLDELLRAHPEMPEVHAALGRYHYRRRDYPAAREAWLTAEELAPGSLDLDFHLANVYRRLGLWRQALDYRVRAVATNPSANDYMNLAFTYLNLRRFEDARAAARRSLESDPSFPYALEFAARSAIEIDGPTAGRAMLERAPADVADSPPLVVLLAWLDQWEGEDRRALRRLDLLPDDPYVEGAYAIPPGLWRARSATAIGDTATAHAELTRAAQLLEASNRRQPDDHRIYGALGLVYAALGRDKAAVAAASRAVELMPVQKDAILGPYRVEDLALVYAWTGRLDEAIDQLEYVLSIPGLLTRTWLARDPRWDPLRGHPRFEALLE